MTKTCSEGSICRSKTGCAECLEEDWWGVYGEGEGIERGGGQHLLVSSSRPYHFLLWRNAQHVELLQEVEEGQHHAHGPGEDDNDPDGVGPQDVGGVPHEPAVVPGGHPIRVSSACMQHVYCFTF